MENILIQWLTNGSGLFGPIQHSNLFHCGRHYLQQMFCREGPIQVYADNTDFFSPAHQIIHSLINGITYGTHGNDDIFRIGSTVIIKQMIFPPGDFGDFLHVMFHDLRNSLKILIGSFPALEIDVRVLRTAPYHRVIGIQRPVPELPDGFIIHQRLDILIVNGFNLLNLMGCAESVKEVKEGNPALDCRQMGNRCQIHCFLNTGGCQHGKPCLPTCHNILMITENGQGMGSQSPCADMKYCRQQFSGNLVHVGDHQQKSLGCGVRRCQSASGKGAMYGSGCAALRLHLNDLYFLSENVFLPMGGPLVHMLRHWRRRRYGINGGYLGKGIGHICCCLVTIHGFDLFSHLYSSSCKLLSSYA